MATLTLPSEALASQVVGSVHAASVFIPMMHFISGVVFIQYAHFFARQASRRARLSFRLGTVGTTLHLGQVIVDLGSLFHSFQYYASGKSYTYFLYEGVQIFLAVGIIVVVQYHFFVIAYATSALSKKTTIIPLGLMCTGACLGGLGTCFQFFKQFRQSGFDSATPLVLRGHLLAFYVAWIGCNGFTDGAIAFAMIKALRHGRGFVKHKSLRTTLSRLLSVIVNTFCLTYLAAMLALIATILPHIIPNISFKNEIACQTAGFTMNSMLSRIYLISFFCSFQEPSYFVSQPQDDSCVASLGYINSDPSRLSGSLNPPEPPFPTAKRVSVNRSKRKCVQVTRHVEVAVEHELDTSTSVSGV